MRSLETLMGLNQQGVPGNMAYMDDPMLQMAVDGDNSAMMEQLGVPQEDPYAMLGMEAPAGVDIGRQLTAQVLGQQPPQVTPDQINAIAQAIGVVPQREGPLADPMLDTLYTRPTDLMSILGGK